MRRLLMVGWCLGFFLVLANAGLSAQKSDGKPDDGDLPDGLKALKHPDPQVRFNAAKILGEKGKAAKFFIPNLKELLKDESVAVRIKAAEAIWRIDPVNPGPLLDVLVAAYDHKEDIVRAAVLGVIAEIGEKAKPALPVVKKGLTDKAFGVRLQAVVTAGAMGPAAKGIVPELLDIMRDDDTGLLEAQATIVLKNIGPGAVPGLRKALADKSAKVRRGSAFALGLLGPKAYEAVGDLVKALSDDEPLVRAMAADAIGKIGVDEGPSNAELLKALKDKEAVVRISAAQAILRLHDDDNALEVLATAVVKSPDAATRESAAAALGSLAQRAKTAVPQLNTALADKDDNVRLEAVVALGKIGPAAGNADQIQPLLTDKSFIIRLQAVKAIWKIEKKAPPKALKVLEQGLDLEASRDLIQVLRILGDIGAPAKKLAPAVQPLLEHTDKEVRAAATEALAKMEKAAKGAE